MTSPTLHVADNRAALASILAARIAGELGAAIQTRGHASIALSGGSTPVPLLRALRDVEIAWPAVSVTLVDERWVDPQSADSNEGLLRRELLDHIGTTIFLPLKNEATSAAEGVAITTATLAQIRWPLDVVVLGMGDDGHTASWFPGAPELDAALTTTDMVVATQPPSAAHARITLSRRAVLNSRLLLLHITGADKRAVLDTALASHDSARLPVCAVLHQSDTPIDIYWSPE